MIESLAIPIVEYIAIIENKYVHNGSANCQNVQLLGSALKNITIADIITPIDNIMSLIIWIWAAWIFMF